jgi:hypothetical protein
MPLPDPPVLTEWLRVMLEEVERKRREADAAHTERQAPQARTVR